MLPMMPRFTIERVRQQLDTSFPTATMAVKALEARSTPRHSSLDRHHRWLGQEWTTLVAHLMAPSRVAG